MVLGSKLSDFVEVGGVSSVMVWCMSCIRIFVFSGVINGVVHGGFESLLCLSFGGHQWWCNAWVLLLVSNFCLL
jgi:hypothetical protein